MCVKRFLSAHHRRNMPSTLGTYDFRVRKLPFGQNST
jgi:hypothetical protein